MISNLLYFSSSPYRSGSVEVKAVGVAMLSEGGGETSRKPASQKQKAKGAPAPKKESVKEEPRRIENIRKALW